MSRSKFVDPFGCGRVFRTDVFADTSSRSTHQSNRFGCSKA